MRRYADSRSALSPGHPSPHHHPDKLHPLLVLGRWSNRDTTGHDARDCGERTCSAGHRCRRRRRSTGAARCRSRSARRRAFWRAEWFLFLLFVGPNLLLFGIFSYWPMISNLYLSMVRWDMIAPVKTFVGSANFVYLLNDDDVPHGARNSVVFTVGAVGGSLLLGLATALLLNQKLRWRNGARAVLFAPTLLSGAAIGIVWVYIFDPRFGLLARLLGVLGIGSPQLVDRSGLGDAGGDHRLRLEERRLQHRHLPGGIAGDPARSLRGGPGRRRRGAVALPLGDVADALADHLLPRSSPRSSTRSRRSTSSR